MQQRAQVSRPPAQAAVSRKPAAGANEQLLRKPGLLGAQQVLGNAAVGRIIGRAPIQRVFVKGVGKTAPTFDQKHIIAGDLTKEAAVKKWRDRGVTRSTVVKQSAFERVLDANGATVKANAQSSAVTDLPLDAGEGIVVTSVPNATKHQLPYSVDTTKTIKITASPDRFNPQFAFIFHLDETEVSMGSDNIEGFPALGT